MNKTILYGVSAGVTGGALLSYAGLVAPVIGLSLGSVYGLIFCLLAGPRANTPGLGWGLGYGIFWWFLGPMTIMPLWQGRHLDWSYYHGQELFGSLVGHIVYGLIVGVIYAAVDRLWIALFIESDPINRQPEAPGSRTVRSIAWGAVAGLVGGLVFLPSPTHRQ